MSTQPEALTPAHEAHPEDQQESNALRVIGWFGIGVAVAALGVYIGTELRSRYKFKRRTPYDFYSNAGERPVGDYGVGV